MNDRELPEWAEIDESLGPPEGDEWTDKTTVTLSHLTRLHLLTLKKRHDLKSIDVVLQNVLRQHYEMTTDVDELERKVERQEDSIEEVREKYMTKDTENMKLREKNNELQREIDRLREAVNTDNS